MNFLQNTWQITFFGGLPLISPSFSSQKQKRWAFLLTAFLLEPCAPHGQTISINIFSLLSESIFAFVALAADRVAFVIVGVVASHAACAKENADCENHNAKCNDSFHVLSPLGISPLCCFLRLKLLLGKGEAPIHPSTDASAICSVRPCQWRKFCSSFPWRH